MINNPSKFGRDLVDGINRIIGSNRWQQEKGLMGMINRLVVATRTFPYKLNDIRQELNDYIVSYLHIHK